MFCYELPTMDGNKQKKGNNVILRKFIGATNKQTYLVERYTLMRSIVEQRC